MTTLALPPAPEQRLTAAIDALLAAPSVELAAVHALERLGAVLTESERLAVVALDGVEDMDNRELFALDGAGSTAGWLRQRRVGGDPRMRAFARRLAECPVVRDAMVTGRLGSEAAQKVCTALAGIPADVTEDVFAAVVLDGAAEVLTEMHGGAADPTDVTQLRALAEQATETSALSPSERLEPMFVFLAERVNPPVLCRTLRDLVEALVPARLDEDYEQMYDEEHLDLQQVLDGRWHVTGYLDPETGAAVDAELSRRMSDQPDDSETVIGVAKRRAHALGALARDGRRNDGSGCERPAADISVVVRAATLAEEPGALAARMADGTRVPLDLVRRLAATAASPQ